MFACYHFIIWYGRVVPITVWNGEINIRLCEQSTPLRIFSNLIKPYVSLLQSFIHDHYPATWRWCLESTFSLSLGHTGYNEWRLSVKWLVRFFSLFSFKVISVTAGIDRKKTRFRFSNLQIYTFQKKMLAENEINFDRFESKQSEIENVSIEVDKMGHLITNRKIKEMCVCLCVCEKCVRNDMRHFWLVRPNDVMRQETGWPKKQKSSTQWTIEMQKSKPHYICTRQSSAKKVASRTSVAAEFGPNVDGNHK